MFKEMTIKTNLDRKTYRMTGITKKHWLTNWYPFLISLAASLAMMVIIFLN